VRKGNDIWCP